jgi:hypothetical protein
LQYNNSVYLKIGYKGAALVTTFPILQIDTVNFKLETISPVIDILDLSGRVYISLAAICSSIDNSSVAFQDSIIDRLLFPALQNLLLQSNSTFYPNQPSWYQSQQDYQASLSKNQYLYLIIGKVPNLITIAILQTATIKLPEPAQQPRAQQKRISSASSGSNSGSLYRLPLLH